MLENGRQYWGEAVNGGAVLGGGGGGATVYVELINDIKLRHY